MENDIFHELAREKLQPFWTSLTFHNYDKEFSSNFTIIIARLESAFQFQLYEATTFPFKPIFNKSYIIGNLFELLSNGTISHQKVK